MALTDYNSGITADYAKSLVRNLRGQLSVGGASLGAYGKDSMKLSIGLEYEESEIAGTITVLEGEEVVIKADVSLAVRMKELNFDRLKIIMGDLGYSEDGDYEIIGGQDLLERKYVENVEVAGFQIGVGANARVGKLVIAKAAIDFGDFDLVQKAEGMDVTFLGRADPANPRRFPATIYFEKPA